MAKARSGNDVASSRIQLAIAAVAWCVFIVYGSLLPFDFTPMTMSAAIERFGQIPFLRLDVGDRADWIANLLLYAPLAFLACAALNGGQSLLRRAWHGTLVLLLSWLLAAAVEFAQIFFPPRSVSLNDLVAECIGALIGVLAAMFKGEWVRSKWADIQGDRRTALIAIGALYAVAYVLLALFPFDVMLNRAEFLQKSSEQLGWMIATRTCARLYPCGVQLVAEALFAVPLGLLYAATRRQASDVSTSKLVLLGLGLGCAIEVAQLLLASGISQGLSALAKAAGFVAGAMAASRGSEVAHQLARRSLSTPVIGLGALVYLAMLISLTAPRGISIPWDQAAARLREIHWLPFYHYYYTSETRALASLLVQATLFAPVGIIVAALRPKMKNATKAATFACIAAALLAIVLQATNLMHPPRHADPTDVLVAIVASWCAFRLARLALDRESEATEGSTDRSEKRLQHFIRHEPGRLLLFIAAIAALAIVLFRFPIMRFELALGLAAFIWLLLRQPENWLLLLLALFPTLDLAPWSGRYFFDEFDLALFAAFACVAYRIRTSESVRWPRWLAVCWYLLLISAMISTSRALFPWPTPAQTELGGYQSPFNALRVGRAFIWAWLTFWMLDRTIANDKKGELRFAVGMTLGLLGVGCIVVWERLVFTGPFNFLHHYRVSATFSATSTAGAQIESYLAASAPFAMLVAVKGRGFTIRAVAAAALALLLYAVLSTASRSAYAGVGLSVGMMSLASLWLIKDVRRKVLLACIVAVFTSIAALVAGGTYVAQRMTEARGDFQQRESHWALVRSLIDPGVIGRLFGMGIGQYPPTFLWEAPPARRPATFSFAHEQGSSFVRLGAGSAVYVEQFIPFQAGQIYTVRGKVRALVRDASISVAFCDKWILYGLDCAGETINTQSLSWETFERRLAGGRLGRGPWPFKRPVKFAIYNAGASAVDVTDLALVDGDGHDVLANGNFVAGGDRWYFSADDHFPWNIFNLFLEVEFEQGWVGLAVFTMLLAGVSACLMRRAMRGNLAAASFLASIAGFMVPAIFDSVIDDPRMRWFLLLLLCGSVIITRPTPNANHPR